MHDRRSFASRVVRMTSRRVISHVALFGLSVGVAMVAFGMTGQSANDTDTHLAFVGSVGGLFVLLVAALGAMARWVVEPKSIQVAEARMILHVHEYHDPLGRRLDAFEERSIRDRDEIHAKLEEIRETARMLLARYEVTERSERERG